MHYYLDPCTLSFYLHGKDADFHKNRVKAEGCTFYWLGGRTNGYLAYIAFDQEAFTGIS